MSKGKNLGSLDYFKLFAAFLVVAIHTSPLLSFTENGDFVFTRIIARMGVPFFFMVTGYFTLRSKHILLFLKKTLFLYMLAVLIYLPFNFYTGHFNGITLWGLFSLLLFDGTFYHLWYLPASIMGVLLVYYASKKLSLWMVLMGSVVLYFLGILGDSYYGFIENIPVLSNLYKGLFNIFSYTRNGLFYAPVFLTMGLWIGLQKENLSSQKSVFTLSRNVFGGLFLLSFLFMISEGLILNHLNVSRHDSMYLFLVPCMFFLFLLINSFKLPERKSFRTVAAVIYVFHPLFIIFVRGIAKVLNLNVLVDNSLLHYTLVCICSCVFGFAVEWLLCLIKTQRFKKGRAWIEIDSKRLAWNINELQTLMAQGCKIMPVLKANAYGHGAIILAKELNKLKIYSFCVASVTEGMELRRHHIKGEILILGYTHPQYFSLLHLYHLTQTVIDHSYAVQLNDYGKKLKVHLKIDTGMHRLGERSDHLESLISIFQCRNLIIKGAYTHLCADTTTSAQDSAFTHMQAQAFIDCINVLREKGYVCPTIHLQASYGLINYPSIGGDYARIGIALYGVLSTRNDLANCPIQLQPILSVKTRIAMVGDLFKGESAGYDLDYIAQKDMKIATLSIGYGDGIPRSLSSGNGQVLINGSFAPIIGRICMDQMLVDVSHVTNPKPDDIAVLIGKCQDKEITVYDVAEESDTITNEVLSRLGNRLYRGVV